MDPVKKELLRNKIKNRHDDFDKITAQLCQNLGEFPDAICVDRVGEVEHVRKNIERIIEDALKALGPECKR